MAPPKKSKKEATKAQMSIRERILGELYDDEFELKKREVHVMTRLSQYIVEIIDALVELDVFKSRSAAVSAYVEKGIMSQIDLYDDIRDAGRKIAELKEEQKRRAQEALSEIK